MLRQVTGTGTAQCNSGEFLVSAFCRGSATAPTVEGEAATCAADIAIVCATR
jgi:hypothetical protein